MAGERVRGEAAERRARNAISFDRRIQSPFFVRSESNWASFKGTKANYSQRLSSPVNDTERERGNPFNTGRLFDSEKVLQELSPISFPMPMPPMTTKVFASMFHVINELHACRNAVSRNPDSNPEQDGTESALTNKDATWAELAGRVDIQLAQ